MKVKNTIQYNSKKACKGKSLSRICLPTIYKYISVISKIHCRVYSFKNSQGYFPEKHKSSDFEIIVIAFNNPQLIRTQIQLMLKQLHADITFVVADNSSQVVARKKIRATCVRYKIKYIPIPRFFTSIFTNNLSHGLALNWVYRNYVYPKSNLKYFGFIDHDIYPLKKAHRLREILAKQGMFGPIVEHAGYWFIWPGLCFFSMAAIKDKLVDFQILEVSLDKHRNIMLDVGSANWQILYTHKQLRKMTCRLTHNYYRLSKTNKTKKIDLFDTVEIFGDFEWLHLRETGYYIPYKKKELLARVFSFGARSILRNPLPNGRLQYVAIVPKKKTVQWYNHILHNPIWRKVESTTY